MEVIKSIVTCGDIIMAAITGWFMWKNVKDVASVGWIFRDDISLSGKCRIDFVEVITEMCICMTEEQKKVINETGNMMVIDFKRILNKIKLSFEELLETVRNCVGCLDKFWKNLWKLQAKEKYTIVRRLNRCGFNEKEINVMVFGAYQLSE